LETGKEIVKSYFDSYNNGSQGIEEVSISFLNTSKSLDILKITKDFITKNERFNNIINLRENCLVPLNQKYVDYYSLFSILFNEEDKILLDKIVSEYVILNLSSFKENLNGFSIYFPPYYFPINLTFLLKVVGKFSYGKNLLN